MARDKKKNRIGIYLIIILAILGVLNIILLVSEKPAQEKQENKTSQIEMTEKPVFIKTENLTSVEMILPAIDSEGRGVATKLQVEAKKGKGRTLIEVDNLLFFADTQHSIRLAKLVAQEKTGINISDIDLTYSVNANASIIGGPSAGAALTIATISALQGKEPRDDVIITGALNRDGSIGPVSEILAKAKASKQAGAKIFLVPLLQSRDVVYETNQSCEKFGNTEICTTETKPKKVNISEEAGIQVIEVENINDAMSYFFG